MGEDNLSSEILAGSNSTGVFLGARNLANRSESLRRRGEQLHANGTTAREGRPARETLGRGESARLRHKKKSDVETRSLIASQPQPDVEQVQRERTRVATSKRKEGRDEGRLFMRSRGTCIFCIKSLDMICFTSDTKASSADEREPATYGPKVRRLQKNVYIGLCGRVDVGYHLLSDLITALHGNEDGMQVASMFKNAVADDSDYQQLRRRLNLLTEMSYSPGFIIVDFDTNFQAMLTCSSDSTMKEVGPDEDNILAMGSGAATSVAYLKRKPRPITVAGFITRCARAMRECFDDPFCGGSVVIHHAKQINTQHLQRLTDELGVPVVQGKSDLWIDELNTWEEPNIKRLEYELFKEYFDLQVADRHRTQAYQTRQFSRWLKGMNLQLVGKEITERHSEDDEPKMQKRRRYSRCLSPVRDSSFSAKVMSFLQAMNIKQLRRQGNIEFGKGNYHGAAEIFRMIINNWNGLVEDMILAYSNRAACYLGLDMFLTAFEDCGKTRSRIKEVVIRGDNSDALLLVPFSRASSPVAVSPGSTSSDRVQLEAAEDSRTTFQTDGPAEAFNIMPYILTGLKKDPANFLQAIESIPRPMLMYVHSYLSYLWNNAVTVRTQKYGLEVVVEDDLVYCQETEISEEKDIKLAEIDTFLELGPRSRRQVKHVTKEDAELKRYSVVDVVLPPAGEFSVEHLLRAYRQIVVKPVDFSWKLSTYSDVTVPLSVTGLDTLEPPRKGAAPEAGTEVEKRYQPLTGEFSVEHLLRAYRQIVVKPSDFSNRNSGVTIPLSLTELDRLQPPRKEAASDAGTVVEKRYPALQLEFTLPAVGVDKQLTERADLWKSSLDNFNEFSVESDNASTSSTIGDL